MYKIWTVESSKSYIDELNKKTNYKIKENIEVKISKRLTKTLAYCKMNYNKMNILVPNKLVFSYYILNGYMPSSKVKDIIAHEFCHLYTDYNKKYTDGHGENFIKNCKKLNCNSNKYCDEICEKYFNKSLLKNGKIKKKE